MGWFLVFLLCFVLHASLNVFLLSSRLFSSCFMYRVTKKLHHWNESLEYIWTAVVCFLFHRLCSVLFFCSLCVCSVLRVSFWDYWVCVCVWYCESKQRWMRSSTNLWHGPTPAWSSVTPAHLKKKMVPAFITNTTGRRTPTPIMSLTADSPTTATKSAGNPWSSPRKVGPFVCVCQDCVPFRIECFFFLANCKNKQNKIKTNNFLKFKEFICHMYVI